MEQESAGELSYVKSHILHHVAISIVFPLEGHLSIRKRDQSLIGYSNAMGITRQILQHLQRSAKRRLCVNDPLELANFIQQARKLFPFRQMFQLTVKGETAFFVCSLEISNKLAAEESTEHLDWEKESFPATDPSRVIR